MHLSDELLNEYLDHETSQRDEIEAHLASCTDCAARFLALQTLFAELDSLPEVELTNSIALRLMLPSSLPAKLPRSLTLTVTLQAALAIVTMIIAAPFIVQFISPYLLNFPAPSWGDVILQIQTQWTLWLDMLSQFQLPTIPEIPVLDVSSLFMMFTVIGVSLVWLIGNGLLLRNQVK